MNQNFFLLGAQKKNFIEKNKHGGGKTCFLWPLEGVFFYKGV